MYEVCHDLLERNGLTADDVALMIPHQANRRIIAATAERLGLPFDRIIVNIDRYGKHDGRHHPAGHARRAVERTPEKGRPGAVRGSRRRLYGRRGFVALVFLKADAGSWDVGFWLSAISLPSHATPRRGFYQHPTSNI